MSLGKQVSTYSVSVNSNGGGSVSSSASTVDEGGSVTITITPNSGYEVASVKGLDGVAASGGTYTISNIGANVTVNVTFQQVQTSNPPTPPQEA